MTQQVRLFICTGEVSGDLQGALLVAALRQRAAALGLELTIDALGGQRMAAQGVSLLGDTTGIGSVGLTEALRYVLPTLIIQQRVRRYLRQHPPDLVVLIDYLGVCVPTGQFIRRHFPVPMVYYIAPQEWVWSHSLKTTQNIISVSDRLLAIFPEEAKYYAQHGAAVTWVGHPLVDRMQAAPSRAMARQSLGIPESQLAVALLPASRHQEIKSLLPIIFAAARQIQAAHPDVQFWVPLSRESFRQPLTEAITAYNLQATLVTDPLVALAAADLAIGKSGTVNLETALLNVPQVVVYRVHPLGLWLYRTLLNFSLDYVSPVNLVTCEGIVPELLQDRATPEAIAAAALELLHNSEARQQMLQGYARMRQALGDPGAPNRAAKEILGLLNAPTQPSPC